MAERSWLLDAVKSQATGLQDLSLDEEVEKFLAGTVGQKIGWSREILVSVVKIHV